MFDGRVQYMGERQRKFYFVTMNSNTPSDQAESSTSCFYALHSCLRYKKSLSGFCKPVPDIGECLLPL